MSDLLSAASLLLAVITILYSLWYSEIGQASSLHVENEPGDRLDNYEKARAVLWSKAIPLAIASLILLLINLPEAYSIVGHAINALLTKAGAPYSAVRTTFVVVLIVLTFLVVHIFASTRILWKHVAKLDPKRDKY